MDMVTEWRRQWLRNRLGVSSYTGRQLYTPVTFVHWDISCLEFFIKTMQMTVPEKEAEVSPEGDLSNSYKALPWSYHIKSCSPHKSAVLQAQRGNILNVGSHIFWIGYACSSCPLPSLLRCTLTSYVSFFNAALNLHSFFFLSLWSKSRQC